MIQQNLTYLCTFLYKRLPRRYAPRNDVEPNNLYITIATHNSRRKTLSNHTKAGEEHFLTTQSRKETLLNNTKEEGDSPESHKAGGELNYVIASEAWQSVK